MKDNKRKSIGLLAAVASLLIMVLAACQTAETEPTGTVLPTAASNAATSEATLPGGETSASTPEAALPPAPTPTLYLLPGATTTSTGLQFVEESAGSGESPEPGEIVTMH